MTKHGTRGGFAALYFVAILTALAGFISFAVDFGHVRLAKAELQDAADAAARAAANKLDISLTAARNEAVAVAGLNKCDGTPVVLTSQDVEIGVWNAAARTFTVTNSNPNAIRVTARRTTARGNAIPLAFAAVIGRSSCDAAASSVALFTPERSTTITVPGTSDPYLAGMPAGTWASTTDRAPSESPVQVNALPIKEGEVLQFTFTGNVRNNPFYNDYQPDGNLSWILRHDNGNENGIADVRMPINAQLGVFLGDEQPSLTGAPAALDFSTAASRDFGTLKPALKQPFFIGDGRNGQGKAQNFVVPKGATRFYLATMDGFEWKNNIGAFTTTVSTPRTVKLVK